MAAVLGSGYLAQATVYNDAYGTQAHFVAYDRNLVRPIFHYKNRFNIVVSFINPNAGAPLVASVNSGFPAEVLAQGDFNAKSMLHKISSRGCWTGMHSVGIGLNPTTHSDFYH